MRVPYRGAGGKIALQAKAGLTPFARSHRKNNPRRESRCAVIYVDRFVDFARLNGYEVGFMEAAVTVLPGSGAGCAGTAFLRPAEGSHET